MKTLYRPIMIQLNDQRVPMGSRLDWQPMAGCLDWSISGDFDVRLHYAKYVETRKKSKHKAYDGRRDYRRVPQGREFDRTICKVQRGHGDHIVRIIRADNTLERVVRENEVVKTVRLFISVQYIQRGLDIWIGEKDSIFMIIRPMRCENAV